MTFASDLPDATLVRVAHAMGIFRWVDLEDLVSLVEGWPHDPTPTFARVRKTQEKHIGRTHYKVMQVGSSTGLEMIFRAAPVMMALNAASTMSMQALVIAFKSLSPEDFNWSVAQFCACTQLKIVDRVAGPDPQTGEFKSHWQPLAPSFEDHFVDEWDEAMEWFQFCVEVNFSRFLAGKVKGAPAAKGSSESNSPTAADGQSGASSPVPG